MHQDSTIIVLIGVKQISLNLPIQEGNFYLPSLIKGDKEFLVQRHLKKIQEDRAGFDVTLTFDTKRFPIVNC